MAAPNSRAVANSLGRIARRSYRTPSAARPLQYSTGPVDEYDPIDYSTGGVDEYDPANYNTGGVDEYDEIENPLNSGQEQPCNSPLDLSTPFAKLSKRRKLSTALDTPSQPSRSSLEPRPPLAELSSNLTSGLTPRRPTGSSTATTARPAPQSEAATTQTTRRRTSELSSNTTAPLSQAPRRISRVATQLVLGVGEITDINEPAENDGHTSCKKASVEYVNDGGDDDYEDDTDIDAVLERLENNDEGAVDGALAGLERGYTGSDRVGHTARYEKDMRHVIRTAKSQAADVPFWNLANSRFCPQTWNLLTGPGSLSEDQIWDIICKATTPERQAILGSGELSDDLVDQLPRATPEELLGSIVYLDWIKRQLARFGYVGVGQGKKGGGTRTIEYEKAKRYSNDGLKQRRSEGNSHLDVALHRDAVMQLRVVLAFHRHRRPTYDVGVLCESLTTDYLRTLDPQAPEKGSPVPQIKMHSAAIMADCKKAQPPRRGEVTPFKGLNQSSPLRQGSGRAPGSIWAWDSAEGLTDAQVADLKRARRQREMVAREEKAALTGGKFVQRLRDPKTCSLTISLANVRSETLPRNENFHNKRGKYSPNPGKATLIPAVVHGTPRVIEGLDVDSEKQSFDNVIKPSMEVSGAKEVGLLAAM
ncbi:hypothetical protein LTR17_010913 [Elasticomyces elasticus]|nr:hypothetical protein LTR17_010913 [Elasticomyces elasticus]